VVMKRGRGEPEIRDVQFLWHGQHLPWPERAESVPD
jgi:hypothetical protein